MDAATSWHGIDLRWAYGGLLRAIVRRTNCDHRAKDALHDSFVRFAVRPDHQSLVEPQAYFRSVVQSVLADRHRDEQRIALLDDATHDRAEAGPLLDEQALRMGLYHPSAQDLYAVRQRLEALQRLLDALPPKCGEAFWLFRIEGWRQPEIAQRLGVSLNMVERHIMRALVDLRAARDLLRD